MIKCLIFGVCVLYKLYFSYHIAYLLRFQLHNLILMSLCMGVLSAPSLAGIACLARFRPLCYRLLSLLERPMCERYHRHFRLNFNGFNFHQLCNLEIILWAIRWTAYCRLNPWAGAWLAQDWLTTAKDRKQLCRNRSFFSEFHNISHS